MARPSDDLYAALHRSIDRARAAAPPPPEMERVRFEARRKVAHVVTAVLAVPLLLFVPYAWALVLAAAGIGVTSMTWAIERRRLPPELKGPLHEPLAEVLRTTRRPGEDYPWSPVMYTLALVLIATAHQFLGLSWAIAFAAYAILGIGDTASALVGVAYGRNRLPWNRKKCFEGTIAGLVAGFLAGVVLGTAPYVLAGVLIPTLFLPIVLAGATAGALAETVPHVEDNFIVPLAAASVMLALAAWTGLPLP
ncbi:MAG: hypothetical protein WDA16_01035 [Candidatus Thermoplasmatota archaeon]